MFCPAVDLNRMSGGEMQCRLGYARADPDDHPSRLCPGISRALTQLVLSAIARVRGN